MKEKKRKNNNKHPNVLKYYYTYKLYKLITKTNIFFVTFFN